MLSVKTERSYTLSSPMCLHGMCKENFDLYVFVMARALTYILHRKIVN